MFASRSAGLLIVVGLAFAPRFATAADEPVQAFLKKHCVECHTGDKPKGDLRLDKLSADFADQISREK